MVVRRGGEEFRAIGVHPVVGHGADPVGARRFRERRRPAAAPEAPPPPPSPGRQRQSLRRRRHAPTQTPAPGPGLKPCRQQQDQAQAVGGEQLPARTLQKRLRHGQRHGGDGGGARPAFLAKRRNGQRDQGQQLAQDEHDFERSHWSVSTGLRIGSGASPGTAEPDCLALVRDAGRQLGGVCL